MMEDNKTIFNYITEVFSTYGIIVAMFVILNLTLGDIAQGHSSFFDFGRAGLSTGTLLQLLLLSLLICVARNVFLSDKFIKNMPIVGRNVAFFVTVTLVIVVFVLLFGWFPANFYQAWIGFFLSFAVCSAIGVLLSRLKEQAENKKMAQALEKFRENKE